MALSTIYKASFLIAEGLFIKVTVYKLSVYRLYSRASCTACYGVSYGGMASVVGVAGCAG